MFTDFVVECKLHKAQMAENVDAIVEEIPVTPRVAVAATA